MYLALKGHPPSWGPNTKISPFPFGTAAKGKLVQHWMFFWSPRRGLMCLVDFDILVDEFPFWLLCLVPGERLVLFLSGCLGV